MPKRMLIDASHPEETRVVVLDGQRVEEFDFEAASKRPLKGNIYLAKVTRVEPSLQAAFVEYGGNRQGFLAFSEIHPDYYQIPVADRMALLAEQQAEARQRQEDDIESFEINSSAKRGSGKRKAEAELLPEETPPEDSEAPAATADEEFSGEFPPENGGEETEVDYVPEDQEEESEEERYAEMVAEGAAVTDAERAEGEPAAEVENNGEPAVAEAQNEPAQPLQSKRPTQRWMKRRHYKIQEVIKRRQVILVQVVKEERGNKGAALTTYLSLAGRYCVLMPNTPRGGGISRKITNATDRKRLKSAAQALELPEGMGLIIRTAGENRTKVEIKRDYEYLLRLWDTIRELTLKSNAPACVYEEGDLIKRAIRDLYNKDVTEVVVEGEDGYRNAKDFMRMLMPSHAKNVKPFKEPVPLFQRHHIEAQLDAMFSPTVTLKSGGYIVINQAEALVAIDVNSGRATREHSIEDTATKTNLEAADEIGRQLRLRDLAGLIVVDFIDMEDSRNDRSVEKRLHNAVKNDRARIQIGKISQFGLLELSRQRLRAGVVAGSTVPCPHCGGQGIVRSVESTALRVLRGLEEEAQKQRSDGLIVRVATDVAIYTLNQKRRELARLETDYEITITFERHDTLKAGDFEIDRIGQRDPASRPKIAAALEVPVVDEPEEAAETVEEVEVDVPAEAPTDKIGDEAQPTQQADAGRRKRRRRRRGGRDRGEWRDQQAAQPARDSSSEPEVSQANGQSAAVEPREHEVEAAPEIDSQSQNGTTPQDGQQGPFGEGHRRKRRRRRGRRGGRDRENLVAGQRPDASVPSEPAAVLEDRFGQFDEIDTTPRGAPRDLPNPIPVRPEAIPNASSTPVWSLKSERAEPAEAKPSKPLREAHSDSASSSASTPPTKKGWWQRTFRSD
jgi:ribonuclease E